MSRKVRILLLTCGVVVLVSLLATLIVSVTGESPGQALPNPNGYDDFVQAGKTVPSGMNDFRTFDYATLREVISTNTDSLRLLRLGLSRQCTMPTESAITNYSATIPATVNMKRLVQLLVAEGRLREMDNRFADAAHSYTDAIRFGNAIGRGGFIINRLVGITCEAIGGAALAKLVPKLKCEETRSVIAELEKAESARITWAEVSANETRFTRYQLMHTPNPVTWVKGLWQLRALKQGVERRHKSAVVHLRLLMVELALRCYQSEQGGAPQNLEQLVPKYLMRVPEDPFSGQPLAYQPHGTNWAVFSAGPKRGEGGMVMSVESTSKGNISFDSRW